MNKLALVHGGVDAAILDIGLPDRRGDALFREIRALYSSIPIVLATGQNVTELRSNFHGERESRLRLETLYGSGTAIGASLVGPFAGLDTMNFAVRLGRLARGDAINAAYRGLGSRNEEA